MRRYGYVDARDEGYPLAAWIWGHRLRIGQHWMEYLLEFLNVLAGFDYELGQGITEGVTEPSPKTEYTRFTRLGLRRFVFYDEWEKTRHPFDDRARQLLQQALEKRVANDRDSDQDPLKLARALLRSFSAVEEQRSWYAKSLFPAHHNLLFWEALRKRATKYRDLRSAEGVPPKLLDAEIAFDVRNFFARGGEIYYLILSAGTQNNPDRRRAIAQRLKELLNDHNQVLGLLAEIIDQAWQEQVSTGPSSDNGHDKKGRLGWIPDPDCPLYVTIAEDVDTLLQADLDPLETLDLLAHLIGFHLTLYIYHRAHPDATPERHADGTCRDACRPVLLADALEGADGGVIRSASATLFREQEARIVKKAREYVHQQVQAWAQGLNSHEDVAHILLSEAQAHFHLSGLHKSTRHLFEHRVDELLKEFRDASARINPATFIGRYADALADLLMRDFRKNFLGVHRKLAKSVGFVAPRKGPGARFVLGDSLLKALTMANLSPGTGMTYDDFLYRLYERYGIIVGPDEARQSGLFDRQRIDAEYYNRNKAALLEKMKRADLAVEYSDATALVTV